jgi:hypothetical protein
MSRETILAEVSAERDQQNRLFGPARDDEHSLDEWVAIIVRHIGLAASDGSPADACAPAALGRRLAPPDPVRFRKQLLVAVAVGVAALESLDRKYPTALEAPRWQRVADEHGEVVHVVAQRDPDSLAEGSVCTYGVFDSQATPWERAHAVAHYYPKIT